MLGEKIRDFLRETRRRQDFLCEVLGVSPATVSSILSGDRKLGAEEYMKICDALEVPLDKFRDSA